MKRIGALLLAGLLGTLAALAATASSTTVLKRTGDFELNPAIPPISVSCPGGTRALVTLASSGRIARKVYTYAVLANGVNVGNGLVQATSAGLVVVRRDIPNNRISTVQLRLNGTTFINKPIGAHCGVVSLPVGYVKAPPASGARGSAASYGLHRNSNGTVTRWNPCDGTIRVKVNPAGGGIGALSDAQAAIRSVAGATGLKLVYDGTTSFVPRSSNSGSQPAPIVIAWATRAQTDYYGVGAIGQGGWRTSGTSTDGGTRWTWKITQGFVVIDPSARVAGGFARGMSRGGLLLHELAHVTGLGHTGDALQVMASKLTSSSYSSWGSGDKNGLRLVGATQGCVAAR